MMKFKMVLGVLFTISLIMSSCGPSEEQLAAALAQTMEVEEVYRVATEVANISKATDTIEPTKGPTNTPRPTPTSPPSWDITDIEGALSNNGYNREPIVSDFGDDGFVWVKDNIYERVVTWDDGTVELQVLHSKSPSVRSDNMEDKFAVLDDVIPADLMAKLREENASYNTSVAATVSGEPDDLINWGDDWKTIEAEYYATEVDIGGYLARFSVWFNQATCPSKYLYCFWYGFPGLEFTGDSSFTYYTIVLMPSGIFLPSSSG